MIRIKPIAANKGIMATVYPNFRFLNMSSRPLELRCDIQSKERQAKYMPNQLEKAKAALTLEKK